MNNSIFASPAVIAARLHALADQLAAVAADADLPEFHVTLSLQPRGSDDEVTVPAIDAVGLALFGRPGATVAMSGSVFHHEASAEPEGGVSVSTFTSVTPPHLRAEKEKVARLERELADARAKLAQAGAPGPDVAEVHDDPNEVQLLAEGRAEPDCAEEDEPHWSNCAVRDGAECTCRKYGVPPSRGGEGVTAQ